jgi:urea transporter
MSGNRIHQGVDQEMEFKGLKAPFLYYMLGLMLGVIFLFLILQGLGIPPMVAGFISVGLLTWLGSKIYSMNRELGRDGMMKRMAYRQVPLGIRIRDREPFLGLKKKQRGR